MNNGITIVAKSVNQRGNSFTIKDFQIVNGCQTSHIIFLNKEKISKKLFLAIKLILIEDTEITNQIIIATNSQTEVKREAFESLAPFHKKLEEFYSTAEKDPANKLYYERRSKQYEFHPSIKKHQIISLTLQVKSFLAMFLNGPHSTHRYYGNILSLNRNQIFNESHEIYPYYVSAFALNALERLFTYREIKNDYRPLKYHLLLSFRIIAEKYPPPPLNSKKINNYCDWLMNILRQEERVKELFDQACNVIGEALKTSHYSTYESSRRKVFTESIENISRKVSKKTYEKSVASTERKKGVVDWFSDTRGYGFIKSDNNKSYFVHYTEVQSDGYKTLQKGDTVSFIGVNTARGSQAKNVILSTQIE